MVIAASKKSGIADLKAFMARIKAEGDKVTFGTAGFGATSDLAPRLLLHLSGLKATVVSYKGAGPAIQDLIGGFVDGVIDQTATLLPLHSGGLGDGSGRDRRQPAAAGARRADLRRGRLPGIRHEGLERARRSQGHQPRHHRASGGGARYQPVIGLRRQAFRGFGRPGSASCPFAARRISASWWQAEVSRWEAVLQDVPKQ